ncbi:MAG: LPS assembly protein LptD [Gammaproteobacteria bacterium]|nr:LPS assembly protein LptD [Gammaproteobacteria bacterium]
MPRRKLASALPLLLSVLAPPIVSAEQLCLPDPSVIRLQQQPLFAPVTTPPSDEIEISAGRVDAGSDSGAVLSNQVEVNYGERTLVGERASFDRAAQRVEIAGRVTYRDPDVTVFGEDAVLDGASEEVMFGQAGFDIPARPARGSAEGILITPGTLSLESVNFTTCPADDVAWQLIASDLLIDVEAGFATARGVKLEFKGVPILYSPYFTFPIDGQRKSGFLTPNFAERDRTGLDLSIPYYLNLRPNMDMTVEPRYLSKRGVQLNTEFRYLLPGTDGTLNFSWLPDDDEAGTTRRYVNLQHETAFADGWSVVTGIEQVSDEAYFEDLGNSLSVTSQIYLDRYVDVQYAAPYWMLRSRLQNYQTIDDAIAPADRPYKRVPQVLFEGNWNEGIFGFDSQAELANFDRSVGTTGWRLDSTQEVSLRFARRGMYLTPAVALRQTNYWLDDTLPGEEDTFSRTLPVASLDAGLKLEREAGRGARWLQTLEPRLLYVHVPFEDQSNLPVFDTILPDFNLIQLFRKYQFVGPDRISDTDQLSFGLTTRLYDERTGEQRLAATLGQTRYLSEQAVSLPGSEPIDADASDYIAELSFGLKDAWTLDVGYQWNTDTERTARTETRFEYRPQEDRLFGLAYRYRRSVLEQGDLSLVWPATDRWRVIGRYSYSFLESEPLEQFVGLEYDSCCWRLRVVGRRFVSRRTGESDSSISLQLELKGFSQRATPPEELLDRGILGYRGISGTTLQ